MTASPMWPNGGWPRSCPSPIASVRSSLSPSARATVRAICVTSSVCVMPRAVVIALGRDEDLRLVLQAPERLAVHDPVAVALQRRAQRAVGLLDRAAGGVGACRERRELLLLPRLAALGEALRDGARCGGGIHASILAAASAGVADAPRFGRPVGGRLACRCRRPRPRPPDRAAAPRASRAGRRAARRRPVAPVVAGARRRPGRRSEHHPPAPRGHDRLAAHVARRRRPRRARRRSASRSTPWSTTTRRAAPAARRAASPATSACRRSRSRRSPQPPAPGSAQPTAAAATTPRRSPTASTTLESTVKSLRPASPRPAGRRMRSTSCPSRIDDLASDVEKLKQTQTTP